MMYALECTLNQGLLIACAPASYTDLCVLCSLRQPQKLAKDARAGSKYVYGGASPDTEAASKAAGHELKGNINESHSASIW